MATLLAAFAQGSRKKTHHRRVSRSHTVSPYLARAAVVRPRQCDSNIVQFEVAIQATNQRGRLQRCASI
jgi:hypothetical protein